MEYVIIYHRVRRQYVYTVFGRDSDGTYSDRGRHWRDRDNAATELLCLQGSASYSSLNKALIDDPNCVVSDEE